MRIVLGFIMLALMALPLRAGEITADDQAAFRDVISRQIEAFRADDAPRAYDFAAPSIRRIFPTPDMFMNMVRNGYPPVYRPQAFQFGAAEIDANGRTIQRVTITGPDGLTYEAVYSFERQPDGRWQINGCSLTKSQGLGV